jgi:molecular chaperone GrpE
MKPKHKAAEPHEPRHPADAPPEPPAEPGPALVEPAPQAIGRLEEVVTRLQTELAETKDKYLRTAAEFDNFRKRVVKERTELRARSQAELVERLIDAIDDLARFAHVDPATTDAKTIHDGVDMVERKIWKQLEAAGVTRIDQSGVPFDPNHHEAVTTQPAATQAQDHTVGTVLQAGYKLGDALIRPARVIVLTWQGAVQGAAPGDGQPVPEA